MSIKMGFFLQSVTRICISACLPLEAGGQTAPSLLQKKYVTTAVKLLPILKASKKGNKLNRRTHKKIKTVL